MSIFRNLLVFKEENEESLIKNSHISLKEFFSVFLPLFLITAAIHIFHIEKSHKLPRLMWIALIGYTIYAWIPLRFRLPYIFFLNITALIVLFDLAPALGVLAVGLLLIFVASLNIKHIYRVILVLVIAGALVVAKAGMLKDVTSYVVASVVGSLFMFRMILYLYEIRFEKVPVSVWKRINYFFMLPNLVFWIFPIVDYKTFVRNFYSKPAVDTALKGVRWIITGFTHLLLYRILYYYGSPSLEEIDGTYKLVEYLALSYLLIIRLSGIFHLAVGIICLFGVDLPRTFNLYFLVTSFSDLWHRVNIYYREFIMKVIYFPIYFKFRKRNSFAVFITILLVFVVNWFFHAYQWFWIRGDFLIGKTDILFWTIMGVFLACNSVLLMDRPAKRPSKQFTFANAFSRSAKILGMFVFMSIAWSLWVSPSLEAWFRLLGVAGTTTFREFVTIFVGAVVLMLVGVLVQYLFANWNEKKKPVWMNDRSKALGTALSLALLCVLGSPKVSSSIGEALDFDTTPIVKAVINAQDADLLHKGYYEDLMISNSFTSMLWEARGEKKLRDIEKGDDWDAGRDAMIIRLKGQILHRKLAPNQQGKLTGAMMTTNEFGLRDKSYSLEKPENTYRIALLGGSQELGVGVPDDAVFEAVLEEQLNRDSWGGYDNIEILNFSVESYYLPQQVYLIDNEVDKFSPDAVFVFTANSNNGKRKNLLEIYRIIRQGLVSKYPNLVKLAKSIDINAGDLHEDDAMRRMRVEASSFLDWGYSTINNYCKQQDIPCIAVYLNSIRLRDRLDSESGKEEMRAIRATGFELWDFLDVYEGYDRMTLKVTKYNAHPNTQGHQIIADKLFENMRNKQELFFGK